MNSDVNLLALVTEDQSDLAGDDGFLGPNCGGQNYDVEALAVALQGSNLYVVVVTGQRPDNGFSRYAPGDIRFTMAGGGTFGLEVGGGPGQSPDTDPLDYISLTSITSVAEPGSLLLPGAGLGACIALRRRMR